MRKKAPLLIWYELIFLVIIVIAVFFIDDIYNLATSSVSSYSDVMKRGTIDFSGDKSAKKVFVVGNNLLIKRENSLLSYDSTGTLLKERRINGSNTELRFLEEEYILFDKKTGDVAMLDEDGKMLSSFSFGAEIEDIKISKDNIYIKPANVNSIAVYNRKFEKKSDLKPNFGQIVRIEANPASSYLVSYNTAIKDNKFSSSLIIYKENNEVFAALDLNDKLLLNVFIAENMFVISENTLTVYTDKWVPIKEIAYDGEIIGCDAKGNMVYLLTDKSKRSLSGKELAVYSSNGEEMTASLPQTTNLLALGEKFILSASMEKIHILNYNVEVLNEHNTNSEIKSIGWLGPRDFYMESEDGISLQHIE